MAQTNYTPIQLYNSTTAAAAPIAANLANGELAINITDGKLYYKDNSGVVQVIATKGAGTIGGSTTQIQYNNAGALAGNAAMVFNNSTNVTTLTTLNLTNALGATYGGTAQSTYTQGDVLYSSAANTLAKLGIGAVNYILASTGSVPQWVAPSSIAVLTATNLAGGLAGSVPYQSALDTTTFLAIGAANRVMTSTGSAPQWVTALTGLTGVSTTTLTTSGTFTLGGTIAGGGNQINNVVIGTTTPLAGNFTTLTTSSTVTINGGTANGVAFLDGSKVLTTGSALTFDGSQIKVTAAPPTLVFNSTVSNSARGLLFENSGTQFARATANFNNGDFRFVSGETGQSGYFFTWFTDGTEKMRLDSSGNLLVGTTTRGIAGNSNVVLSLANGNATAYQSIRASGGEELYLVATAGLTGLTAYSNSPLTFGTNNTERARIDASGNLGIGTTSPSTKLEVVGAATSTQYFQRSIAPATESGTETAIITTGNASNQRAGMYASNNYATNNATDLIFKSNDTTGSATERMRLPAAGGVQAVTSISVGNATPSASGAGITFPATQSASSNANTLDDYEEGVWTPAQGAGLTVVGTFSSSGVYTKIGRMVYLSGTLASTTSLSAIAGATISGNLPFTTISSPEQSGVSTNGPADAGAIILAYQTFIYTAQAIAATIRIEFNVAYQV